jgi:hypothetical protein
MSDEIKQKDKSNQDAELPTNSMWEEIRKGWEWVVFSIRMLGRMGGPAAIAQTLGGTLMLLIQRTLRQWGIGGKK